MSRESRIFSHCLYLFVSSLFNYYVIVYWSSWFTSLVRVFFIFFTIRVNYVGNIILYYVHLVQLCYAEFIFLTTLMTGFRAYCSSLSQQPTRVAGLALPRWWDSAEILAQHWANTGPVCSASCVSGCEVLFSGKKTLLTIYAKLKQQYCWPWS